MLAEQRELLDESLLKIRAGRMTRRSFLESVLNPGPLQTCSYDGKLWAVPFATDAGLLYSRSHLISATPATWDQMTSLARSALSQVQAGYVWQGQQYEGLVCNFDALPRPLSPVYSDMSAAIQVHVHEALIRQTS